MPRNSNTKATFIKTPNNDGSAQNVVPRVRTEHRLSRYVYAGVSVTLNKTMTLTVVLEKLKVAHPNKKTPRVCTNPCFISVFPTACEWCFLDDQSLSVHPLSKYYFTIQFVLMFCEYYLGPYEASDH